MCLKIIQLFIIYVFIDYIVGSNEKIDADGEIKSRSFRASSPTDHAIINGILNTPYDYTKHNIKPAACVDASELNTNAEILTPWPNATLPVVISKEFSITQQKLIRQFIEDISRYTCIQFVNRTDGRCDYVLVTKKYDIPWTFIGYSGLRQRLNIVQLRKTDVLRGFLNVLGIVSQHNAYNRDDYIHVKFENINIANWHRFQKYPAPTDLDQIYDFKSITHFPKTAFSKNQYDTITPMNPNNIITPMNTLSPHDIGKLNHLYNCKFTDDE